MSQEVELRALIKDGDSERIHQLLKDIGAELKGTVYIHDVYFCDKSCQTVEDAEMNKVGSYSIRIRKEIKNDIAKITYNTKTITKENDHHSWEEHEEDRDDFDAAKQEMLDKGYKFFFELEKNREKYKYNNMEICIEDIKDFGLGIEVEIITDEEHSEEAKSRIIELLGKLGVGKDDIVPKSITNIIMHQRAFKN